jgi:hypothetical protein
MLENACLYNLSRLCPTGKIPSTFASEHHARLFLSMVRFLHYAVRAAPDAMVRVGVAVREWPSFVLLPPPVKENAIAPDLTSRERVLMDFPTTKSPTLANRVSKLHCLVCLPPSVFLHPVASLFAFIVFPHVAGCVW